MTNNKKSILIIGKTGAGKSALANVIVGINRSELKFEEGASSISTTKNIQTKGVEIDEIKYKVIDTVGIGDTGLDEKDVSNKINEAVDEAKKNDSSQILLFFLT